MHEHISSTQDRWNELDTLINQAAKCSSDNYISSALGRATVVMTVAHFEGFLKDTIRALINDINSSSHFRKIPDQAKRIFCRIYTGTDPEGSGNISKEDNVREKMLIELFDGLQVKLSHDPFTGGLANPKPDVIIRLCKNFGVPNFFGIIDGSRLDDVFSGDSNVSLSLIKELEDYLLIGIMQYPYRIDLTRFSISTSQSFTKKETLWQSFVNDLLSNRNQIAHGILAINSKSDSELREMKNKAMILSYAIALVLCTIS